MLTKTRVVCIKTSKICQNKNSESWMLGPMGIYHGNPWDISWVGNNEDIPGIYLGYLCHGNGEILSYW